MQKASSNPKRYTLNLGFLGMISEFLVYSLLFTQHKHALKLLQFDAVNIVLKHFWHSFWFVRNNKCSRLCSILWSTVIIMQSLVWQFTKSTLPVTELYLHIASGPWLDIFSQDTSPIVNTQLLKLWLPGLNISQD